MGRTTMLLAFALLALLLPGVALAQWIPVQPGGGGTAGATAVWTDDTCTRISDSSFSVVDDAGGLNKQRFRPGVPMRFGDVAYSEADPTLYLRGLIKTQTDVGATLTIVISTPAMNAAHDAYCQRGAAYLVVRDPMTDPGQGSDGIDAALMLHDILWIVPPSSTTTRYLMEFCVRPITDDTGAAQPGITPYINGQAVSMALTVTDAAYTCTSAATMDLTKYDLLNGEVWEIGTDAAGSNDDASNYSFVLVWLYES